MSEEKDGEIVVAYNTGFEEGYRLGCKHGIQTGEAKKAAPEDGRTIVQLNLTDNEEFRKLKQRVSDVEEFVSEVLTSAEKWQRS